MLITAATDFEMNSFLQKGGSSYETLITGVGPVETTLSLSCRLQKEAVDCVLNFGIAGAYPDSTAQCTAGMLDICLAEQEILADFGILLEDRIERFALAGLPVKDSFIMDSSLLSLARQALTDNGREFLCGNFLTVNCASGTHARGSILARQFAGLCENMEGGAIARVCKHFAIPCLEVRCISNLVEDRNVENWRMREACTLAGQAAAVIAAVIAAAFRTT